MRVFRQVSVFTTVSNPSRVKTNHKKQRSLERRISLSSEHERAQHFHRQEYRDYKEGKKQSKTSTAFPISSPFPLDRFFQST